MTRRFEALSALAARVTLAHGWRRALMACAAGALSALAMPPFGVWPILALTLPVAVWLIDGASAETRARSALAAAWVGFVFGFGYFLAGLWWIGSAFLVDADVFGWLLPVAVAGLPALLGVTTALAFALARLIWSPGWPRVFAFAAALGLGELLRGHIFTGFPWNSFGYALADQPWLGQFASVVGVEGLTFVAIAIFAAPATLADPIPSRRLLAAAALALIGLAGFGGVRLNYLAQTGFDARVRIRAIQPEIPQDMKSQEAERDTIMETYLSLSDEARGPEHRGFADAELVVWPESAFPFLLSRAPDALARIGRSLARGATLATGSVRGERRADGAGADYWNALHLVGDDGSILATYDKIHLVPFGEYLPFQTLLESFGLEAVTRQRGGFASGVRQAVIALPQGPRFRPLICYEAIFPEEVSDGEERPDFLLNVTNDAWFGRTPGPYQHAAQARVRAVEQGLPMVRSANGGISSIVDAYGRIVEALPLGTRGVVDGFLPLAIEPTVFVTTSGRLFLAFPVIFLSLVFVARSRV
ncbi:apolipoprotein N-acyltransferase [Hansschlegelia plantiphila]|uniref:Apolipoprotein N-acyltransferase n=1 Tax=Hansschlegelia plantiphila TaxID=374655 RepID=A0A9W6IZ79_9HYPH|nr:apolipoprotein N-acyltransferase [Hansschlegelia plantiphila]GLK66544.1 apolipoprotein N-acyltransferase [Hansschlegelia plantiphila]